MPQVVTCILEHEGQILLLKRSSLVGTYRGLWGGVAGYVEEDEAPYDTALKEIREEAGLDLEQVSLVKQGNPVEFSDEYDGRRYEWMIYPFLFHVEQKEPIHIDWEHEDYQWIDPKDLHRFESVPHLKMVVAQFFELR
jgi:8-oxo-dGTP pyrophosphatase MutT (NUDIX family)